VFQGWSESNELCKIHAHDHTHCNKTPPPPPLPLHAPLCCVAGAVQKKAPMQLMQHERA
jgi:hypothetical protein